MVFKSNAVRQKGFTLIELMIVVAIVGIIAAVAYPSYVEFVQKSRRGDAMSSLADIRIEQEKYRANNITYAPSVTSLGVSATSREGFYTIAVVGGTGVSFAVTAAPTGAQAGDACGTFAIDQNGADYDGYDADADCWER